MNNKKGFTIVELLATLFIIGIVIAIAIVAVGSISQRVKENQYKNLLTSIQVAGEKYYAETGSKRFYVNSLISAGLISADSEQDDNKIYNPLDSSQVVNCYIVSVDEAGRAVVSDKDDEGNPIFDCNLEELEINNLQIGRVNASGVVEAIGDRWLNLNDFVDCDGDGNKEICLGVMPEDGVQIDDETLNNSEYKWHAPAAPGISSNTKFYKVDMEGEDHHEGAYNSRVKYNGEVIDEPSANIKIDAKRPTAVVESITNEDSWTQAKTINFKLSDEHSGLAKYAVVTTSVSQGIRNSDWKEIGGEQKEYTGNEVITQNGTYYIWVMDKAGNINAPSPSFTINSVDNIAPKCLITGESTVWTNGNRVITYGCIDDEPGSGCKTENLTETYITTTKTDTLSEYEVEDNAGNKATCKNSNNNIFDNGGNNVDLDVNVYVDKTIPKVDSFDIKSTALGYNSKDATVIIKGSDTDNISKVDKVCITSSNNQSSCEWKTIISDDGSYSADYRFAADEGSGTNYTLYAFVMDEAGNVSASKSETYKLYTICTTKDSIFSAYGECSKVCGGGTKTRTVYYQDTYLGGDCGSGVDSASCGSSSCCSETKAEPNPPAFGTCSNTCGTGTQTRKVKYYSTLDGSYCKEETESQSCSVTSGCPAPTVSSFTISTTKSGYNSKYASVTIKGASSATTVTQVCISTSNSSANCSWQNASSNSYTGNYTFSGNDGSGTKYTLYAFVKDAYGKVSASKSASYTLYKSCTKTTVSSRGSYGNCSKSCGTGTKTRTVYNKDTYLGTSCANTTESANCNTQSCCSSTSPGYYGSWGGCSTSCGSGNKYRSVDYYSTYDGRYCSTQTERGSCYESYGCEPEEEDCELIAVCFTGAKIKIKSNCTISSPTAGSQSLSTGSCSASMIDSYSYYLKFSTTSKTYECKSGAYHDGEKIATNTFRYKSGVAQYKTSGSYKELGRC